MSLRDELLDLSNEWEDSLQAITDAKRRDEYWVYVDRLRELARSLPLNTPAPKTAEQIEEEAYYPI